MEIMCRDFLYRSSGIQLRLIRLRFIYTMIEPSQQFSIKVQRRSCVK